MITGVTTGIEWTDHTWNFAVGCEKVSPGCKHCYAETLVNGRMGGDFSVVRRTAKATFDAPYKWEKEAARVGKQELVFTCSLSDVFLPAIDPFRHDAWNVIHQTPHLTYQILTKRPGNISTRLPPNWGSGYPNVWLGSSVELQQYAPRLEILMEVARNSPTVPVRFVSAEPLLGPLDLREYLGPDGINWVIVGGESGKGHRPMKPEWVRAIRDQCLVAKVPFFFKQWGGNFGAKGDHDLAVLDEHVWKQQPAGFGGYDGPAHHEDGRFKESHFSDKGE